jgi:ribosome recycling factor
MPTIERVRQRMDETIDAVRREFGTVRTGKATPSLLEPVRVEAYGSKMPLNQVASLSTPEGSMILVQPFDRSLLGAIEKAIQVSGLGFNPSNDGQVIRVPVPALTEERRKEYVKVLIRMAEEGRVSIRHARREGNDEVKGRVKEGEVGDDEGRRLMDEIQKLTDQSIAKIEELLTQKEKEVMTV